MRLCASAYLAHAPLAGTTFSAAAEAGATLAFTSLHIPEDSPAGARAAATAIVCAAASAGLSVVADVSPNTAWLLGDSPWEFLRWIGVARVRIDFGFSIAEIQSIAAVLVVLDGTAALGVHPAVIEALAVPDRNRPDAAEPMIRLEHSRERFAGLPLSEVGEQPKPAGSVTVQLASAGIVLRDLPADDRVAVLGALAVPAPALRDRSLTIVLG